MKRTFAALLAALVLAGGAFTWHCWQVRNWRDWQAFARVFVQADGRVVDRTAEGRSTSEAQAYALFFALVANDRPRFDAILRWTADNLAGGDLTKQLPAWLWGQKADGSWGVKDANPASDADIWLAYSLIEGARLWQAPELATVGEALIAQIKASELAEVPGVGQMLLPAPQGFKAEDGSYRLNPSYLPEFQFRWLATVDAAGPWSVIWQNHERTMAKLMPHGVAPDWYEALPDGQVIADRKTQGVASYDAIRVPLWAGLTEAGGGRDNVLARLSAPFLARVKAEGKVPERLDSQSGNATGGEPLGFVAAVLPLLAALDEDTAVNQRLRLKNSRVDGNLGAPPHYYDQALGMFGEGWDKKRFRFAQDGRLIPRWERSCCDWLP